MYTPTHISVKTYVTGLGIDMEIRIRPMVADDWEWVRLIYLEGIATGEATFETNAPSWQKWDSSHLGFARLVSFSAATAT